MAAQRSSRPRAALSVLLVLLLASVLPGGSLGSVLRQNLASVDGAIAGDGVGGGLNGNVEGDERRARILTDANGARRLEVPLDRRMRSDDRRALRQLDSSQKFKELAQISREPDGVYWSWLHIGPNAEDIFSVIVDTGSSTIAVPCKDCSCGDHRHFDPSSSDGSEILTSKYSQCYSEGSCNRGNNVRAPMCLGKSCDIESEGIKHVFGCCSTYANPFKRQFADGIIGMMGGNDGTLIAALRQTHRLETDLFSMCLASRTGVLGVGGFDETRHLEPIQWTPLTINQFYRVTIENVMMNGQPVQFSQPLSRPIVDSGTTFTYVEPHVADALKKAFQEFCNQEGNCPGTANPATAHSEDIRDSIMCYAPPSDVDYSQDLDPWLEKFPSLELEFEAYEGVKARICIPPGAYFFRSNQAYCVGILRDSRSSFVLGALTMGGFDYVFDHGNNRLGIARSICDKTRDNEPGTRTSTAECCGSCAVAQKNGFRAGAPKTSSPTLFPSSSPTKATPAPTVVSVTPKKSKTDDGMFFISSDEARFGNKTVLIPVSDSEWSVSDYTFSPDEVLLIKHSANICEQDSDDDDGWVFARESLIVIEGHDTSVTVGASCALPNVRVASGATLKTKPGPAGSIDKDEIDETPSFHIRIDGVLDMQEGHMIISSASTLYFSSSSAGIQTLPTSRITMETQSGMQCINLSHDRRVSISHGMFEVNAGSIVGCYTSIGDTAMMVVGPDPEMVIDTPAVFLGKLEIAGTIEFLVRRQPFRAFSLLVKNTISYALMHFKPKLRITEADEGDSPNMLFRDVPEKARLYAVKENMIEDRPFAVEYSDVFSCAKVQVDEGFSQLTFPTEDCLNRCLNDDEAKCSVKEQEYYPWPPESQSGSTVNEDVDRDDDEDEKSEPWFDLSSYKEYVGESVQDPEVQKSATGGAFLGIFMAIAVFMCIYPPRPLAACCCCCRRRQSGPRHTFDSI